MKTRKRRPHPTTCGHCRMVEDYRAERERQIVAWENGGFRNRLTECTIGLFVTFKEWLINLGNENRAQREMAESYA